MEQAGKAFKTISEAADTLGVPQHVLRFWEEHFSQVKPLKLRGGRRYYRPEDIDTLTRIKTLLYQQGYTIKGAKKHVGKAPSKEQEKDQLSVIRQELIALKETLKPYMQNSSSPCRGEVRRGE